MKPPSARSSSVRASMENSPRYRDVARNSLPPQTRPVTPRSISTNPYPTTFVETDTSSFKQVVQMLTGFSNPTQKPDPRSSSYSLPPIKAVPNKKQSSVRLYERRNSTKHMKINPVFNPIQSGLPENLSPSILDFPSLALSPVTPLMPDPFYRSGSSNQSPGDPDAAEERAIKEKGFYLHPSPSTTPRDSEPRLLPLFPVTSPRVSDSDAASA